jgi:DNA-binding transcriptional LysR family regulator
MLSYKQLETLVAVAEELHFSRAADRLGVAQSAVSMQIQLLESELGVHVLNRNKLRAAATRGVTAMPSGVILTC